MKRRSNGILKKQVLAGVALSKEEINEFGEMVDSDNYTAKEIQLEYGISQYEYDCYLKIYRKEKKIYEN